MPQDVLRHGTAPPPEPIEKDAAMRLYNNTGATQVDDPQYGTFKPGADGAFDGLPEGLYAKLHGRPGWENDAERVARVTAEQLEKMRDPATMLAEMQKMSAGQGQLTALLAKAMGLGPAPADTPPAGSDQTLTAPEPEAAVETAKAASGRGRQAKPAKTPTPEAS